MNQSPFLSPDLRAQWERDGYVILPALTDAGTVATLRTAIEEAMAKTTPAASRRGDSVFALRNVLRELPTVRAFTETLSLRDTVADLNGGTECFPIRAIVFDKTPGANWNVIWHQDLSVTVRERHEVPGWGPWSKKAGVWHVQPPASFLETLLTVRLHLDTCGQENGPLRVLPGTHQLGRLGTEQIAMLRREREEVICPVPEGGALLMRPLLLHASGAAQLPGHRRVLHIEWARATMPLPGGLQWSEAREGHHYEPVRLGAK